MKQERKLTRQLAGPAHYGWLGARWGGAALLGVIATLAVAYASGTARTPQNNDDATVLATVGSHRITQKDVDDAILRSVSPAQLYDLRKASLDKLVDEYLLNQAARKAGQTPAQYLAAQGDHSPIADTDARKFYDEHKAQIDTQTKGQNFEQVKSRIVAALERNRDKKNRVELMARLRAADKVNVTLAPPRFQVATGNHPWTGGEGAPITLVEFSDFQCPYCRAAEAGVKAIRAKYGGRVKLVYEDFPLGFHEHAMDAARAAHCANDQGKFWQYHDALFADQSKLAAADLKNKAAKLGLDSKKFASCFDTQAADPAIKADQAQGESLGVTGTPTFFVNGRQLTGAQTVEQFSAVIDEELAGTASAARQANNQVN